MILMIFSVAVGIKKKYSYVFVGDMKLCAGGGKTDSCNGDSGGPLLSNNLGVAFYL
jgi:secreted trypsin-like serine protease